MSESINKDELLQLLRALRQQRIELINRNTHHTGQQFYWETQIELINQLTYNLADDNFESLMKKYEVKKVKKRKTK